ncbi:hypothetical protein RQP46_009054 [Phenoliferia psychrophenolica]
MANKSEQGSMRAAVYRLPGGPEVLKVERMPIPVPTLGRVLIRVHACGMNRSEMFTRQGHSPGIDVPRVLGIEAVGVVAECPGGEFAVGDKVATAMGGLGRQFDGGYAEYCCPPVTQVQVIKTELPWATFAAMPEMLQTAWGSLFRSLKLVPTDRLLVRGGTTSVGLAALGLAKNLGAFVASTTRNPAREQLLKDNGADLVLIDSGTISDEVKKLGGFNKVLELIGTTTLIDSLQCASADGIVCMTGIVGDSWELPKFAPFDAIPTAVFLTTYQGGPEDFMATPLADLAAQVAAGTLKVQIGRTFKLDDIEEAHRCMEENQARGKIVLLM